MRLTALRSLPYAKLSSLPATHTEHTQVAGKRVAFTVYRELASEGELLILVRSDRPLLLGVGSQGTTEGFWLLESGMTADAMSEDISEYFA